MTLTRPFSQSKLQGWPGLIEAYRSYLPVTEETPVITLQEGNTPLIPVPTIAHQIGGQVEVFIKYDGLNPTGSFKDRGMTLAISKAKEEGAKAVICASTGNTSAAAAAYARRGGMRAFVIIPDGYVALGKLAQALLYGAEVLAIKGNFDQALEIVRDVAAKYPVTLVNSVNPYRLEGQKTGAFEVVDTLGDAPDWLCIPVGNAGNITAYWMGFCQYHQIGKCDRLPQMMGFQAAGAAPIVQGHPVVQPETVASAIRIGNPASWEKAVAAQQASQGSFTAVTDEEILEAYRLLASNEGIFCEPASAASVAGLLKVKDQVPRGAKVVCVLTGHGLKDPDVAIKHSNNQFRQGIEPNIEAVAEVMGF
ncbi:MULTISPECIES: threonine synthase [Okeania]|uniref:Threonine synthase n=1 Tax=Okeania hirsuta TaxID=1458930 RepID=A0A3N6PL46_9CYAN|nr:MULTISPECIES: threonine synthase [Okeania]NEP06450.1 threonine synthase [Okeania sp. SIO4D6]NEP38328.1 threonine synthase [Okeania sp. SIO2H7]NEP72320.1 threonine synthase [Okeania sp. SIO2G5]NEP94287.1 threonine synthase [Okeania sp. SIO2F5]NEQ91000.1 threonine synthase [Okeania sp. SIO2G4]